MKYKVIAFSMVLLLICSAHAFAHAPKAVSPSFDSRTNMLTVNIAHSTTNPAKHHIYKVQILVNGKKVKEDNKLGSQKNPKNTTYTTELRGINSGDSIQVKAFCNRGGSKVGSIKVSGK